MNTIEGETRGAGQRRANTMVGRVARSMALAAVLGGLIAALAAGLIADRMLLGEQDRRLADAIGTLAVELGASPSESVAQRVADAEAAEVLPAGIHVAVFAAGRFVGGDSTVAPAEWGEGCRTRANPRGSVRVCARRIGSFDAVTVGSLQPLQTFRRLFAASALLALALAAASAALSSSRVAAWVVRPLTRLHEDITRVEANSPDPSVLRGAEDCEEVDAVRAALTGLLARLAAALAQSQRFAADAAHELRTPLTTVLAELELLAEDLGDDAAPRQPLQRVRATLTALAARVESLLIIASPHRTLDAAREAVALSDVIEQCVAALTPDGRARVSVRCDGEGMVRGDPSLLAAMIANAVENALKFSTGTPVMVQVSGRDDHVTLDVDDEGPGVPADERDRVFLPFYRTPSARAGAARGHGLGLALIAHIASVHGGAARFEEVSRGARLRISLPAWSPSRPRD